MENERPQHECGIFGYYSTAEGKGQLDAASVVLLGLESLQHRGQEGAGIITCKKGQFKEHKGLGHVSTVFTQQDIAMLEGDHGVGHTRYSTSGNKHGLGNLQPFIVDTYYGTLVVAHNGQLVNKESLRKEVMKHGVALTTSTDSELIVQLLTFPPKETTDWPSQIKNLVSYTPLAYSLLLLTSEGMYAVRDPFGNRPLCLGAIVKDGVTVGHVASSESCGFPSMSAKYVREVAPGEIVCINSQGLTTVGQVQRPSGDPAFCIFEYIYFARPDSILEGQSVYKVRTMFGKQLAIESPVEADIVSAVPESSIPMAYGYAHHSGLPYVESLWKNRYAGRSFIQSDPTLRKAAIAKKFGVLVDNFKDKRIILIDDSIVRSNTMLSLVRLLKEHGAKEVHVRIASPPIKHPCNMGIDIPTSDELIASANTVDEICTIIGADSLAYLSLEGLHRAVRQGAEENSQHEIGYCDACLTGNYPSALCDW